MDYMTTIEASEKWGISTRRVTKLCNEDRVEGAVLVGTIWLIPKGTEKPEEKKRGRKTGFRLKVE